MKRSINYGGTAKTLHNALSDCECLFRNLHFLTINVSDSEAVEQLNLRSTVHTVVDSVF